jgi:polysaccharide biosynthesis/export protein
VDGDIHHGGTTLKKRYTILLGLLLCFALYGTVSAEDYVIGEGDVLFVSVWGEEALNVQSIVRPDGRITVPGLGEVAAAGKTPSELQLDLSKQLQGLVKYSPIVTVSVTQITNSRVFVFGGGVPSRVVQLNQRTTLLHLLTSLGETGVGPGGGAGGAGVGAADIQTRSADLKRAYVLRGSQRIKENFYSLYAEGDTSQDILLKAGDIIFIPALEEQNVYVLGAVNTPRAIPYRQGMSVLEAILEAGGFTRFANENQTFIVRKQDGKNVAIPVRAKDLISKGVLEQNVPLQLGDYVIVREGMF